MAFDPDEYLASSSGSFDPDEYLGQSPASAPKVSMPESALRGSASGFSMGYDDEIAGALSAVGRPFGVKGLGGRLSDIELTSPTADLDEISNEYTRVRDLERKANHEAEDANPKTYFGSQIAGGIGSSLAIPGLNAAKGAKLASFAGKSALQGGITGGGMSEADNVGDFLIDTAVGTGLGLGGGIAGYGAGKAASKVTPWISDKAGKMIPRFGKVVADVPEEYTEEYLKRGGNIAARTESEILDDLTTRYGTAEDALQKAKDEVGMRKDIFRDTKDLALNELKDKRFETSLARSEAQDSANSSFMRAKEALSGDLTGLKQQVLDDVSILKNMVSRGSKESYDILDNDPNSYSVRGAARALTDLADQLNIKPAAETGLALYGDAAQAAYGPATPQTAAVQKELQGLAEYFANTPEKLPARELKKILQQLDESEKASYGQPGFDSRISKAYKMVRGVIDDAIKTANPEYAAKMSEVSENSKLLNKVLDRFGSESQTIGRLKGIGTAAGRDLDAPLLRDIGEKTGSDWNTPLNEYLRNQDTLSSPQAMQGLRESLPEYQKFSALDEELTNLMDPRTLRGIESRPDVSGAQSMLSEAEQALLKAKENYDVFAPVKPGSAQAKLRSLTGARDYNPKQIFEKIDEATGQNFSQEIKDRAILDSFDKTRQSGSRRAVAGTAIGSGLGSLVAGPFGATVGGGVGGMAGFAADKYAGRVFKGMLDGKIAFDQGMKIMAPKLGKYANVLQQASQRGPQGVASTHFLLQQSDPQYRLLLDKIANDEENEVQEVNHGYIDR